MHFWSNAVTKSVASRVLQVHNKGRSIMRRKESYLFILFNDILIYASRSGSYAKYVNPLSPSKYFSYFHNS